MTTRLSIAAYARHRGCSHVAVLKAIKSGRIVKEADGTIDPVKADADWERNTNQAQQRKEQPAPPPPKARVAVAESSPPPEPQGSGGPNYAQSRAIKEAYHARLAKLSFEEKSGALVRTDNVKVAWFNILRVMRDRILNMPDRMAPLLSAEDDPKKVREMLDIELRQLLDDAADAIANINTPIG